MITDEQILHVLQHSLGLDQYGHGTAYRNHFCTGEGSKDFPICEEAVVRGLMRRLDWTLGTAEQQAYGVQKDYVYKVTVAGRAYILEKSPSAPKVSRGRAKYLRWLKVADCGLSFGDWLKRGLMAAFLLSLPLSAAEIDPTYCDRVADAIYKAEGGQKTRHPYGVLSVKVKDAAEARRVCKNTISRVYRDWSSGKVVATFIETLADVYCPPSADPTGNKNWKRNVNYFMK